jgi:hypothetical protein
MTTATIADDRRAARDATTRALVTRAPTISVDADRCGGWRLTPPLKADSITYESLSEARRAAYRLAADLRPCQIVTFDAYHRVVHRKFIDSEADAAVHPGNYHAGPEMCI